MDEKKFSERYSDLADDICKCLQYKSKPKGNKNWDGTYFSQFILHIWEKNDDLQARLNAVGLTGSKKKPKEKIYRITERGVTYENARKFFRILGEAQNQDKKSTLIQLVRYYNKKKFRPKAYDINENQEIVDCILDSQNDKKPRSPAVICVIHTDSFNIMV